ncbi:MAG TPA: hypothetical protein VD651_01305 [Nitrosarchaeum sp.]|nr:hypothetical protein [Nitrosarchaeum sp.]
MTSLTKNIAFVMLSVAVIASSGTYAALQNVQATTAPVQTESGAVMGHVEVVVTDADGNIKAYRQSDNAILDAGKDAIADEIFATALSAATTADFTYIEVDTDGTAAAETQTALIGVATCARVQDTTPTGNSATNGEVSIVIDATFAGSGSGCAATFQEAGLFNASTSGDMMARNTFTSVTLTTADSLAITWTITLT